ncbi:hypothetical protein HH_0134 [Helicobacter hepaticus ATCC 51449]|uniref:Uncharacterized protein n=1 Tax=Helicobacter hepaticus (strain ATCC 51449 / 3B1) TaxID=235279 RepID=Q7VJV9_HELHP|nr:hypothetical protein HH_0134 [Helicobacter hepaticus ATCC 51449]
MGVGTRFKENSKQASKGLLKHLCAAKALEVVNSKIYALKG